MTGVEAIADDVPAFRAPKVRRAMRTEVILGGILGTRLLGLAILTVRFHVGPTANQTVLSQITGASVGRGTVYYVVDLSTTVILALAANTSFGDCRCSPVFWPRTTWCRTSSGFEPTDPSTATAW